MPQPYSVAANRIAMPVAWLNAMRPAAASTQLVISTPSGVSNPPNARFDVRNVRTEVSGLENGKIFEFVRPIFHLLVVEEVTQRNHAVLFTVHVDGIQ